MMVIVAAARHLAEAVAILLFGLIVAVFGANIAARYLFNSPIIWADEIVVVLMLWSTFFTAAFVLRDREHVAFDLLYERLPAAGRRWMAMAGALLVGAAFAAAFPAILDYTRFLWRERTNVLEWRLDWVYACFPIFVAAVIGRAAWQVGRLAAPSWRRALARADGAGDGSEPRP
jgi:TRAP-type C4-dicarboxylate transport system permease small subunit